MQIFSVDELCPPAPLDGYFWRQISSDFLSWAEIPPEQCHPFRVDAADLEKMCAEYERTIQRCGGLDLIMLGLGPNGHIATNEPGSPFDSRTRPVGLMSETQVYIRSDEVQYGTISDRAVTLGIGTIMEAKEIVLLVSGAGKREALKRAVSGTVSEAVPASVLQRHPGCLIIADQAAAAK
jgi:glucosamine-6-phosphate deaminase